MLRAEARLLIELKPVFLRALVILLESTIYMVIVYNA